MDRAQGPGSQRSEGACVAMRVHVGTRSRLVIAAAIAVVLAAFQLSVAPVLAATADEDHLPNKPLVEGRKVFEEKGCIRCHGISLEGDARGLGPDLGRGRSWQDLMQLSGSLWNHAPTMLDKMKAQGVTPATLSPDEMGKLSTYLLFLNFLDQPGDAARGREVFESRSCARCHQFAGHGGTMGPRLDEIGQYASSLFMTQALWNHGPEMSAKMAELGIERPRLAGDDITNIIAFIRGPDLPPPSPQDIASQIGSPRAGKALFTSMGCIKCHAISGSGGTAGPDLSALRMPRVSAMAGEMWNHGPAMWEKIKALGIPFPRFDGSQMSDLLAFLYFAQYMDDRGDQARGAKLFREKSCADCHDPGEGGSRVGPDLPASEAVRSPLLWASAIWNHAPAMAEQMRKNSLAWPQFADDEMRDLVAFLRARRQGK